MSRASKPSGVLDRHKRPFEGWQLPGKTLFPLVFLTLGVWIDRFRRRLNVNRDFLSFRTVFS
jgi:hypothetical protein